MTQEINPEEQATMPGAVMQRSEMTGEIEQQSTMPLMIVGQQNLQQQPTQSLTVEERKEKQGSSQPRSNKQPRHSYATLLWWAPLAIFALLLASVIIGRSAIANRFLLNFSHNMSPTSVVHENHPVPNTTQASLIDTATVSFMDAMMHKDWTTMWSLLSPDAQQLWQGEKDFIHFERAKYCSIIFTSYRDSSAQVLNNWIDPNTTRVYSDVVVLRVSLVAAAPRGLLSGPSSLALRNGLFENTLFALVPYNGNWRVLVAGPADPDAPILVPASAPTTKLLVPIFMYHHVSNLPVPDLLEYGLTVTTTNFNIQLTWLQQQGYHSITMTELFDALYYGKALPAHPMILTFDDGYKDAYTDALPVLLAHHYRGVFYIITGMIGGSYVTWEQVRTLAQDGMQVASHTVNHVNVGQPPVWTSTQNELLQSKETLETQLRLPIQFFCYPTGEPFHHDPVYEQQMVLADLYSYGYVGATLDPFSFDSAIQNAQSPYQLPRIRVSGGESMLLFISILDSTLNIDAIRLADGYAN
jgi:peptidoglycan/xylan/chitin deacetylase (PgdA/CDA1 family)